MPEAVTMLLFIAGLLICIGSGLSIFYALIFGLGVFFVYGLIQRHSFRAMLKMSVKGVGTVKNILLVFVMIGALTAVWRAAGTIPYIIYYSTKLISPHIFVLATFLLCSLISVLTGTSFGTSATMGVICMTMGRAMGINPLYIGGAALSGSFFGDRCSPMSTSALLVRELTHTDIYRNIRLMVATSALPFALACAVFLALGFLSGTGGIPRSAVGLFAENFSLVWETVLPAAIILVLSAFRVDVRITISLSVVCGGVICMTEQGMRLPLLLRTLALGFRPQDAELSAMLSGGGLVSMLSPAAIVFLSSTYSGIFEGTGLLSGLKKYIGAIGRKLNPYGAYIITSAFTAMLSCNQTLAIMLTDQLCGELAGSDTRRAICLENTAVIISPLIPWCIAGTVSLAAVGAPMSSIPFAGYLFFVPLWNWLLDFRKRKVSINIG